jgi:hypothetical protein
MLRDALEYYANPSWLNADDRYEAEQALKEGRESNEY